MKLAILASTAGSNLPSLFTYIKKYHANTIECILITNKADAGAIEKAKQFSIPYFIVTKENTREEYDKKVLKILQRYNTEYIFMIGYMRIVSPLFVETFRNKIFNIHPSLLPAFAGGMSDTVHQDVINFGCKITGATLHIVSEEVDAGKIINQKACDISEHETVATLKPKVQKLEQEMLKELIHLLVNK
ncbi:TPA: phosphoribosylglycinamide formyltransferase [Candidatus Gracilibacteria bacterium]|nr:phosphoribosylglycinamide formyltransferase [Candidatus Peregrinibacteria bacterium]HIQ56664.1 phosphoribosylglycinamide formyltransferase [Candidatus Gracilibacteria bacterium]HIQ57498.1 phosphoribosylglycinamide formyltransferase [Candidatus Gracilibacteria bacterium]